MLTRRIRRQHTIVLPLGHTRVPRNGRCGAAAGVRSAAPGATLRLRTASSVNGAPGAPAGRAVPEDAGLEPADGREHRGEQAEAVGRGAGERVDGVLGVRHQPDDPAVRRGDPGDVVHRAVRVRRRRSGRRCGRRPPARRAWRRRRRSGPRRTSPGRRSPGPRERSGPGRGGDSTRAAGRGRRSAGPALRTSAPGSRPASQRIWKPLQMPSTGRPRSAAATTSSMIGAGLAMAPARR